MGAGPQFWRSDTAFERLSEGCRYTMVRTPTAALFCSSPMCGNSSSRKVTTAFPQLSLVRTVSGTLDNGKTVMKNLVTLAYASGVCWEGVLQSVGTAFFQGVWGHIFLICTYSLHFYPFLLYFFFIVMGDIEFRVWCMNLNHSPVELHSLLLRYPLHFL